MIAATAAVSSAIATNAVFLSNNITEGYKESMLVVMLLLLLILFASFGMLSIFFWSVKSDAVYESSVLKLICFIAWPVAIPLVLIVIVFDLIFGE